MLLSALRKVYADENKIKTEQIRTYRIEEKKNGKGKIAKKSL